jgi:hypothetical protein
VFLKRVNAGVSLLDVFLETDEETLLDYAQLWQAISRLLEAEQIDPTQVIDFWTRVKNSAGEWVTATRNTEGRMAPVPRQ